jgi:hypothetical protein
MKKRWGERRKKVEEVEEVKEVEVSGRLGEREKG